METIIKEHGLRNMTLRYKPSVTAPDFETRVMEIYREMHDRTLERKKRILEGRLQIPALRIQIEELNHIFERAKITFSRVQKAYDTNPYKDTLREQLNILMNKLNRRMLEVVHPLIDLGRVFDSFDEYGFQEDQWLMDVAFPACSELVPRHEECAVDVVFFDEDLDDFRAELRFVMNQQKAYYNEMAEIEEGYDVLNEETDSFIERVDAYDDSLLAIYGVPSSELEGLKGSV